MNELRPDWGNQLYVPMPGSQLDGHEAWSARYKLPDVLPRAYVITELHRGVQLMKYLPGVPFDGVAPEGLSGVLFGPNGDHDAEEVEQVLFTTDPSKTYGERNPDHSERHALFIAKLNGWIELDQDGQEISADQEDISVEDILFAVIGRNKDRYDSNQGHFSFEETQAMLSPDARFSMTGGYHFSDRPTWDESYGEPAVVLRFTGDHPDSYGEQDELQLFRLARALNNQHRLTILAPWGAEAYESNPNAD
jgi:hypothetical protein